MERKNKVTIKINGQDYPVAGEEPKEYLLKVGNFVDEKMHFISKHNSKLSTSMIAVLTCINIADQFLKLERDLDKIKEEHTNPLEELIQIKGQYDKVLKEFEEKKESLHIIQKQAEELMIYKEQLEAENKALKENLENKVVDLDKAEGIINDLQNKLFENQIKLVQARKQLEEHIEGAETT
ncbi:MAG: cell division protein ZapA [Clostridiaceae bacterium]|nr:cell division protein ZapA [Clostridiaceae bacterium]